ncbi:MAG: tetratricopeptide repeat protein, partial [Polyangiales bacterium]
PPPPSAAVEDLLDALANEVPQAGASKPPLAPTTAAGAAQSGATDLRMRRGRPLPATPSDPAAQGHRRTGHTPATHPPPVPAAATNVPEAQQDQASVKPPPAVHPAAQGALRMIKAHEKALGQNPDPKRAARLHYEIARLAEYPLHDLRRGRQHFQEALKLQPDALPVIRGARRMCLAQGNGEGALALFDAEIRITPSVQRKVALLYAKGRLLEDSLGREDEARLLYASALELERSNLSLLKAIEQQEQAHGSWDGLDQSLRRQANAVATDSRHRAALIARRAQLIEAHNGSAESAAELYESALRLDPHTSGALAALKRLHYDQQRWRDLIRVLDMEAESTTDPQVRTLALYRSARVYAERLGERREAIAVLERAHSTAPDEALVLEELARLYEDDGAYASLVQALERLADLSDHKAEKVALLQRIGQLLEDHLGRPEESPRWYRQALALDPTTLPVLQSLGKRLRAQKDWRGLIDMHLGEAEHSEQAERRAAAHTRIAEIYESNLQDAEQAMEHHSRALSILPGYAPAFKALSRLYSEAGKWRALVELFERAVGHESHKTRAISFLFKIGSIYEDALQEYGQAAHAYRRILTLDANNLGAMQAWQRSTERGGRYLELVDALEYEAERSDDVRSRVTLLHRAGEVLEEKANNREAALERFQHVLQADPHYIPALVSLGRLYFRAGRWEDLLDMYERELALTPKGPTAVALLHKMAELCEERIGRDHDATHYYWQAVQIDPGYLPAVRALSRRLRAQGDFTGLARLLQRQLEHSHDDKVKARTAYRLGEVYEEGLQQPEAALAAYEKALASFPNYRPASDALARLRASRGAWDKRIDDLEQEARTTTDARLAIAARIRQGQLWAEQLSEPRRAITCFEQVLGAEPDHPDALLALEPLYRSVGGWDSLGRLYRTEAQCWQDSGAKIAALRELFRLQQGPLHSSAAVQRNTLQAILDIDETDHHALDALERLTLQSDDVERLIELDKRMCHLHTDPGLRAALTTRLAESLEHRPATADDDSAIDLFRQALTTDPRNLGAAIGLARLASQADDPEALAEAARLQADFAGDSDSAAALLLRSAQVRIDRLGDRHGATSDVERALEICPHADEAARMLSDLLQSQGQHARLAERLARAASSRRDTDGGVVLWTQVAELQVGHLHNLAGAIGSLTRALRLAPNHQQTLQRLA